MLRNNADARRCSYFELGLPVELLSESYTADKRDAHNIYQHFVDSLIFISTAGLKIFWIWCCFIWVQFFEGKFRFVNVVIILLHEETWEF